MAPRPSDWAVNCGSYRWNPSRVRGKILRAIPREGCLLWKRFEFLQATFGSCEASKHALQASPVTTSRFLRGMEVQAIGAKSTTSIRRRYLERDEGIVCAARNCRASHRRQGLAPRCRLVASWGWSRSQGLGCSPIKAVRELGLERRETVRSLSVVGAGDLRGVTLSTRGPG